MRLEAEVRPDGTVLGCLRRPPISRLPPLDRHGSLLRARPTPLGLTSVEHHGDSRIAPEALAQLPAEFRAIAADHDEPSAQPPPDCPCALMVLPSAGRGPGGGTRMALMDPSSITFLAIVVVASGQAALRASAWPRIPRDAPTARPSTRGRCGAANARDGSTSHAGMGCARRFACPVSVGPHSYSSGGAPSGTLRLALRSA